MTTSNVVPIRSDDAPGITVIPMPPAAFLPGRDFGRDLAAALLAGKPPGPAKWDLPADPAARYVYVLGVARGMLTELSAQPSRTTITD